MAAPPAAVAGRAERARELVQLLAEHPRPAGSDAEASARALCAERLRQAGFVVREETFDYSSAVGRWGTPVGGMAAAAILLVASNAGRSGHPRAALAWLTLGAVALAAMGTYLARVGVLTIPAARRRGVNLIATRPAGGTDSTLAEPTVWLMAHLDSKSQPIPILARAAGITVVALVWFVAIGLAAAQTLLGVATVGTEWLALAVVAAIGAAPVIATTVGARSPGALDNASGVATILAAAEGSGSERIGVCLTSAEELGLAGARAWVRQDRTRGARIAINCDGVDDVGRTTCMHSGRRPDRLVASVLAAAARTGVKVRAHRLFPGVLTDGVALADAGWDVVTLSRGSARTLARIHTPRDSAKGLTGHGISEVAGVIIELLNTDI